MYKPFFTSLLFCSSFLNAQMDSPFQHGIKTTIFQGKGQAKSEEHFCNVEAKLIEFVNDTNKGVSQAALSSTFLFNPQNTQVSASQLQAELNVQVSPNLFLKGDVSHIYSFEKNLLALTNATRGNFEVCGNIFYKKHNLGLGIGVTERQNGISFPKPTGSYRYTFNQYLSFAIQYHRDLRAQFIFQSEDEKLKVGLYSGKETVVQSENFIIPVNKHEVEIEYKIAPKLSLIVASGFSKSQKGALEFDDHNIKLEDGAEIPLSEYSPLDHKEFLHTSIALCGSW